MLRQRDPLEIAGAAIVITRHIDPRSDRMIDRRRNNVEPRSTLVISRLRMNDSLDQN